LTIVLIFLLGCAGRSGDSKVDVQPFIGGTDGLEIEFLELREDVFDGGDDPFDVILKVTNKGERDVLAQDVTLSLSGVRAQEFNKREEDLRKTAPEDILALHADSEGNIYPEAPAFIEFLELNHVSSISGAAITLPLRADACYKYGTDAVSKLCIRKNLISPSADGICEIDSPKEVFNSGAPVHVGNLRESTQGRDKIRFMFDITHEGTGTIFEPGSTCELDRKKNKVIVKVDTKIPGLTCTGLETRVGTYVEGIVTLYNGIKTVQCTQQMQKLSDYEQAIDIDLGYIYEDTKTEQLIVKHVS
jgi:hypothetical protein